VTPSARAAVPPFAVMSILNRVAELRAAGRDVISLCAGEPSQGAPSDVRRRAAELMIDRTPLGYSETFGIRPLRRELAGHYRRWYGLEIDPDQIALTTGSSGAFLLSFVPYIGLVLALIPPTILAYAESGLPAAAVIVVGGVALNLLAENVLEPSLTGRALSLTTWLVFTMFFFWVWLMGPVGALLSMPITVLLVLVLQHNEPTRWVASLLARDEEPVPRGVGRPWASPPRDAADAPPEGRG